MPSILMESALTFNVMFNVDVLSSNSKTLQGIKIRTISSNFRMIEKFLSIGLPMKFVIVKNSLGNFTDHWEMKQKDMTLDPPIRSWLAKKDLGQDPQRCPGLYQHPQKGFRSWMFSSLNILQAPD